MAGVLPSTTDCCTPCSGTATVQVSGPSGDAGAAGAAGTNGDNAYTTTNGTFIMPDNEANVTVTVVNSDWMTIGQVVFVQTAGDFEVQSKASSTTVVLKNLEDGTKYPDNVAPSTEIATASQVGPGGQQGVTGTAGASGAPDSVPYWTGAADATLTSEHDISALTDGVIQHVSGTPSQAPLLTAVEALAANGLITRLSSSTAAARTITGTSNQITVVDGDGVSGNPTLSLHADVYRAGGTDVPVADGGTGASTPPGARTNLGLTFLTIGKVQYQDEQTMGTAGGTASATTWNVRPLTEKYDTGTVGTLAGSTVTLGEGTYVVNAWAVAYQVGKHQIKVRNIDDSTDAAIGTCAESNVANGDPNTISIAHGRFTINSSKQYQLWHYTTAGKTTDGLGEEVNISTEVYAGLEFVQESE